VRRFYLIALLLVVSLFLVGFLVLQAHAAVSYHRQTAESVLRDYAGLASSEFVRRTLTEVGYYGYYPLTTSLRGWASENPGVELVEPSELPADEESARARELARALFRYTVATGVLESSSDLGEGAGAALGQRLARAVEEGVPLDGSYVTIFEMIGGATRNFVFTPSVVAEERALEIVGFEVELSAMGAWIERGVERGPLLPESLTGSEFSNDSIFIETLLSDGETLYRRGDPFEPWYGIEKPFGDSYRGVFEDLTVRLAIDPEVAPQLVIGGLPRSRLPLLLGILALVAGLLLSAILQLRRERALIRLRSDFVSRVSHELRTPLTQIRMFAETLLLGRVRSEQEKQRAVEVIDREARRLSHLVENVLQYSRSERETTQLAVRPRRLTPLLSELVEDFNPLLDGTGARVSTHFEDGPRVSVDEDALRQIVLNLLENAVKYGPDEHEVQLGTHRSNGSVRLWVDDQGPGIRPADRERIWEPFQRVEPEVGSALTGTGIGLSVVRELVTLHGGSSWVEDGSRGGARFVVELPATAANGQGAVE
jgi:signal transduction histidine kinase